MKKTTIGLLALALVAFAGGWFWSDTGAQTSRTGGDGVHVVVYQNPSCGCCGEWVKHMETNGFDVEVHKTNVNDIKRRENIGPEIASCHTAYVDGYLVEGHVPARDIKRMLAERPDIRGLAVPGMPMGSPGMEGPRTDRYDVVAFDANNRVSVYASY